MSRPPSLRRLNCALTACGLTPASLARTVAGSARPSARARSTRALVGSANRRATTAMSASPPGPGGGDAEKGIVMPSMVLHECFHLGGSVDGSGWAHGRHRAGAGVAGADPDRDVRRLLPGPAGCDHRQ